MKFLTAYEISEMVGEPYKIKTVAALHLLT